MRVCAPVVGSEQITTMFQTHLHDDKSLHYGEFINDLTKYLVRHNFTTSLQNHVDCTSNLWLQNLLFMIYYYFYLIYYYIIILLLFINLILILY